jgi:two-component system response regulator FixJ
VHRASLMTKLDVHNLADLLRIAFAAGLDRKAG